MHDLLVIENLRAGYGAVEVLRSVDMRVAPGELIALLGSNGAGKTTLNAVVSGLVPARSGKVVFEGEDLTGVHYRRIVQAGLIQVPEGRKIFPNLTVIENLELGAFTRARNKIAENMAKVFETFPR